MYIASGWNPAEMGDVDVIAHEDHIHLFHLSLPSHDVVAHLVSDDGLTWQPLPNAIATGDPGSFDDDQIWTMGTFAHDGRFFMLYTAMSRAEGGLVQRVGLATSDDLVRWQKYPGNPVVEADPRWYEARTGEAGRIERRVDWRDPFVFAEGGVLHGLICARENQGPSNRRGCVGYFTSTDGYRWQVQPPFYAPRVSYDFEVPTLFRLEGRYYLTGICGGHERDVYRVADALRGPWRRLPDDGLLPTRSHALRTCFWRGKQLLFHWVRGPADWAGDVSLAVLAPPKVAGASDDGALILRPFEDWAPLHAGAAEESLRPFLAEPGQAPSGEWQLGMHADAGETLAGASAPGFGALLSRRRYADAIFEIEVATDGETGGEAIGAQEFGIVLRADDEADQGTFVSCVPGRHRVEVVNLIHLRRGLYRIRGRGRLLVQTFHHTFGPGPHRLRVVARGPLIEASVDGRVVATCLTMRRRAGRWGVFVEDGRAVFRGLLVQPLQPPAGFGSL